MRATPYRNSQACPLVQPLDRAFESCMFNTSMLVMLLFQNLPEHTNLANTIPRNPDKEPPERDQGAWQAHMLSLHVWFVVIHYKANAKAFHLRFLFYFGSHWSNIQEPGKSKLSTPVSACQHVLDLGCLSAYVWAFCWERSMTSRDVLNMHDSNALRCLRHTYTPGNFDMVSQTWVGLY